MALTIATRLGPYEILAPLGSGGMGEVWKARDTRLDRVVAIKTVNGPFSERFEREARAISALNHPHICTLYDVGEHEGAGYLVMELVDGAPLAGPVPLERALIYASQICSALEAAHKKGIVHRDLKPANILVTKSGVKLLDFGLAKQRAGEAGGAGRAGGENTDSHPGTDAQVTKMLTGAHVVVGTPQYMAPEQIEGHAVDARTDIFALGCVLYELLTGKKAFEGKTPSSVMAAILATEPRPLKELQPLTPASLERAVKRCLAKDPDDRWQSARDLRAELEWIGSGGAATAETAIATRKVSVTRRILPWLIAAAATVGAGVALWIAISRPAPVAPLISTSIPAPGDATFELSTTVVPVLSPDGRWIVFAARTKNNDVPLWIRRLDSPSAQVLPGTNRAAMPFWSPDSRFIAFYMGGAVSGVALTLKKLDITGGAPVTLKELPTAFRGGAWNRNGVILFGLADISPIRRISDTGSEMTTASALEPSNPTGHRFPVFLPDGTHFLYSSAVADDVQIRLGSLDSPTITGPVVVHANSNVVFSEGRLLFLRGNTLMAQAFDLRTFTVNGDVMPIADAVPTVLNVARVGAFTASATGTLAYYSAPHANLSASTLAWVDRTGKFLSQVGDPVWQIGHVAISPSGKSAAVTIVDGRGEEDISIYDLERGIPTRFTSFKGQDRNQTWAPDGQTLFWSSPRANPPDIYRKAISGAGDDLLVYSDPNTKRPYTVSPDGRTLLFGSGGSLQALSLDRPATGAGPTITPFITPAPAVLAQWAAFSPDGKWVAFDQNDSGRQEIFVAPFPGPGRPRQITSIGASYPRWRHDGKELFYVTISGELRAVDVTAGAGDLIIGRDRLLFGGIIFGRGHLYDVSEDGQKFLIAREDSATAALPPLTLVQNWTNLLAK